MKQAGSLLFYSLLWGPTRDSILSYGERPKVFLQATHTQSNAKARLLATDCQAFLLSLLAGELSSPHDSPSVDDVLEALWMNDAFIG